MSVTISVKSSIRQNLTFGKSENLINCLEKQLGRLFGFRHVMHSPKISQQMQQM